MVYLVDWKNCLENSTQLTNIKWYFDNYGPFVEDVDKEVLKQSDLFHVEHTTNFYGSSKTLYSIHKDDYTEELSENEKKIIDMVIEKTKPLSWEGFINFIYSTYPIATSERYSTLDLVSKAIQYRDELSNKPQV